eukprot:scaffold9206_cov113-Isochrysis_galbana.AAC.8
MEDREATERRIRARLDGSPAFSERWGFSPRGPPRGDGEHWLTPFGRETCAKAAFTFLGVECDFSQFSEEGWVLLGISRERGESIANEAEAFLAADALPPGSAAKFAGRLAFATSWAAGCLGRPVLRPICDQALRDGARQVSPLLPSVRGALAFLIEVLRRPGGLPPALFPLRESR